MSDGSMFEQPDFSHAQAPADDDMNEVDDELEDYDEDDDADDEGAEDDAQGEEDEDDEDDEVDEALEVAGASTGTGADDGGVANRVHGAAARAVLEHLTRTLVDDGDSVVVEVSEGRSGLRFSVHVAPGDMGRVIGRKGRTAQAIRTLVRAAAAVDGTEASVDIVD